MIVATICAWNEERYLPGCLESLRGKVGRTVVIDGAWMGMPGGTAVSTDRTAEIARTYGVEVYLPREAWPSEMAKRTAQFGCAGPSDWLFVIDADERLIGELPDEETLTAPAYAIAVASPDARLWRTRLYRWQVGLEYRELHEAVWLGDELLSRHNEIPRLPGCWLFHDTRARSAERRAAKDEYYQRAYAGEYEIRRRLGLLSSEVATVDEKVMWRYAGPGFIIGIPARDLTDADLLLESYDEAVIEASGLYERMEEKTKKKERN